MLEGRSGSIFGILINMLWSKLNSIYKNYEYHISSIALVLGFIFDVLTLRRADAFWENFWVVFHLIVVATAILLINRKSKSEDRDSDMDFWLLSLMQFSFGGLLSAFLILYFRSASLAVSWPFLLMLALAFIANERLKRHYQRLTYQVSFFFSALLLFSIFFVPVVVGYIGPAIFVFSGLVSLLVLRVFLAVLRGVIGEKFVLALNSIRGIVLVIFVAINVLYFTNIIPPIPLSLREGGVYHLVDKEITGQYVLRTEKNNWLEKLSPRTSVNILPDQPLFVYTAIFSPAKFSTKIVHEWQYFEEGKGEWVSVSRILLPITGGRNNGYRTYSISSVVPGSWRVNVMTERGQVLGRIWFKVDYVGVQPELVTEVH